MSVVNLQEEGFITQGFLSQSERTYLFSEHKLWKAALPQGLWRSS